MNDANSDFTWRIFKEAERRMERAARHRTMRGDLHLVHNSDVVPAFQHVVNAAHSALAASQLPWRIAGYFTWARLPDSNRFIIQIRILALPTWLINCHYNLNSDISSRQLLTIT